VNWSAQDAVEAGFEVVMLDDLTRAVFPERAAEVDAALARVGVSRALATDVLSRALGVD